jgi:hypothetical protein
MASNTSRDPRHLANTVEFSLPTGLIEAGSAECCVILPPGYDKSRGPYPLVISLHPAYDGKAHHLTDAAGAERTGRDILAPRPVVWASFMNSPPPGAQQ